jgi:hypothetical protein
VLIALLVTARGLERRTTWYLASDQFAFLTFADDLRHGRVFHDPGAVAILAEDVPRDQTADALYQTYLWRDGRLYSRYPPGFPLLLAAAGALGGERAMHLLNPLLYLVLVAALALFTGRLLRGAAIAAAAGAAAPWALLVVPTEVHYWGITVARDLPAHLLALGALAAACGARFGLAGLALGFACCIRPDAVLYALSLGAVALGVRPGPRSLVGGSVAFVAGIAPLLAYNTITQGHPLAFTQGMEFRQLMSRGAGPPVATASILAQLPIVSGGGFRLRNLPQVLPQNLRYLGGAFGLFLLPAVGALLWALRRRTLVAGALAPYLVGAIFFYSCWGYGDARYLVGAVIVLLVATAIGTTAWCAALADPLRPWRTRAAFLALTLGVLLAGPLVFPEQAQRRPLELAVGAGAVVVGGAALVPALGASATAVAPFVPALAFAGVALARVVSGSGSRDPFQDAQVERARTTMEILVPAGSVVVTTPALGRPAENITHYTHATAYYDGEPAALGTTLPAAARAILSTGRRVYLLVPAVGPVPLPAGWLTEVARRSGPDLYDWFVDPSHTDGAVLLEVTRAPGG